MKRKITLTEPQFHLLGDLVKGPQEAVLEWPPARKLTEFGFAQVQPISFGRGTYTITDAGRAHYTAVHLADKKCKRCKTAPWECRSCGRKTCEHYCGNKTPDRMATCGRQACQTGKPAAAKPV